MTNQNSEAPLGVARDGLGANIPSRNFTHKNSGWVRTSDVLPPLSDRILGLFKGSAVVDGKIVSSYEIYMFAWNGETFQEWPDGDFEPPEFVPYWCPLPELPLALRNFT